MYKNQDKKREAWRRWYNNHKDKTQSYKKKKRVEIREWIQKYKAEHSCKCGESRWYCLDFHHTENNKEFDIASHGRSSWKKIKEEIEKCDIVCSNCHREIHYNQGVA